MELVTFSFDLGDQIATYTGRVVGQTPGSKLVRYYEPTCRDYLTIDLPVNQIESQRFVRAALLPLSPMLTSVPEPRRTDPVAQTIADFLTRIANQLREQPIFY